MSAKIEVRIENLAEVQRAIREKRLDLETVMSAAVEAGAEVVAEIATSKAPGKIMHEMVKGRQKNGATAHVGPPADKFYWRFLEKGTPPHVIRPSNKKMLRLYPLGEVFARQVMHPGIKARPFLRPAVDENVPAITDAVGKPIKAALE